MKKILLTTASLAFLSACQTNQSTQTRYYGAAPFPGSNPMASAAPFPGANPMMNPASSPYGSNPAAMGGGQAPGWPGPAGQAGTQMMSGGEQCVVEEARQVTIQLIEESVSRQSNMFIIPSSVNGSPVNFTLDTGAGMVVLTAQSAARLGYNPSSLTYNVPVTTANGNTTYASVVLRTLTIGRITEQNVQALVARPGDLQNDLLGLSFLDRLASYEVQRDRLILRGNARVQAGGGSGRGQTSMEYTIRFQQGAQRGRTKVIQRPEDGGGVLRQGEACRLVPGNQLQIARR